MKSGKSLQELAVELHRQAESKRDFTAPLNRLHAVAQKSDSPQKQLVIEGVNGGMTLRPTAHKQMAEALKIPGDYYMRMLAEAPDLLARNVNRWLGSVIAFQQEHSDWFEHSPSQGQKKLIRTLDGQIRAILSDSYRPLDNYDLAEAVLPKLHELEAEVLSSEITESRFYLKAATPRIQGIVRVGDTIRAGIALSNSEIGLGSLRLEELDYKLECTNGMIRDTAVRKAHLGRGARGQDAIEDAREWFKNETRIADDRAFFLKVRDAAAAMFDREKFDRRLLTYKTAAEQTIEGDPVKTVELVSKRFGLNETERTGVLQHLIRGADLSQWGLSNAITRASQDIESYDRATDLESIGGDVVQLDASVWRLMSSKPSDN